MVAIPDILVAHIMLTVDKHPIGGPAGLHLIIGGHNMIVLIMQHKSVLAYLIINLVLTQK
jgi:hypothetical protein